MLEKFYNQIVANLSPSQYNLMIKSFRCVIILAAQLTTQFHHPSLKEPWHGLLGWTLESSQAPVFEDSAEQLHDASPPGEK